MSQLPDGVEIDYSWVTAKITQCTSDAPQCWYRKHVGETFTIRRKTWYENGVVTSISYELPQVPGGGFNGYLSEQDIEIL